MKQHKLAKTIATIEESLESREIKRIKLDKLDKDGQQYMRKTDKKPRRKKIWKDTIFT